MKKSITNISNSWVRSLLPFYLFTFLPLTLLAQKEEIVFRKGNCTPQVSETHTTTRRALATPNKDWDANKTYKQMVILLSFSDTDFSMEEPQVYYNKLFNEEGFNERQGPGCVAEYFKTQSNGLFNVEFDVYGPVKVSSKAQPYDNPTPKTVNNGTGSIREATTLILEAYPEVDYSQYDWNGDGSIEQIIYVYAGRPGNTGKKSYGHIWPNTHYFTAITTPDGKNIRNYTASGEYWAISEGKPIYCGLGTIIHEYSHSLGLPDIYPTGDNDIYSAVDEWDLMDGGNVTNWGWCPPNYSPLEKMLLGWATPIELSDPTTITDLKPVAEGGAFYQIKYTDTEYLLLENRQQKGWDAGLPGEGLVIYHVNYDPNIWKYNNVNSYATEDQFRYKLVHADNMTYNDWDLYIEENFLDSYIYPLDRMNSNTLSTSPYPTETNNVLSDTSTPFAKMSDGKLLSKPIRNIQLSSEGVISFDFMKEETAINDIQVQNETGETRLYDLSGQRVFAPKSGNIYIIKKNGVTNKVVIK